ncbi:MAG: hypothetical protein R6X02_24275 [Enhygromyxa sp.]
MSQHDQADLAALRVLQQLVDREGIEFVTRWGVSSLGPAVASFLLRQPGTSSRGAAFAAWLIDQDEVRELYFDDDQIEELLRGFWDERGGQSSAPAPEARRADLEAMLREEPEKLEHRLVYGDWLQAHQDPFGELITRQLALASEPDNPALARAASTYLREHAQAMFGPLAEYLDVVLRLDWRGGFIEAATLGKSPDDPESYEGAILLRWLLEHRAAMLLRELELQPCNRYRGPEQLQPALAVLFEHPRPLLRRLTVGTPTSAVEVGELARLDELLPNLESLELRVQSGELIELRHPKLRRLVWHNSYLGPRQAAALASLELPRLEHLSLGDFIHADFGPIFARAELPSLRGLQMPGTSDSLDWLVRAPWRTELEELDLSGGSLEDHDAGLLASQLWPRLRRLDLSNNQLGEQGTALVAGLCPEVVLGEQRPVALWDHDEDDEGEDDFYDSVQE